MRGQVDEKRGGPSFSQLLLGMRLSAVYEKRKWIPLNRYFNEENNGYLQKKTLKENQLQTLPGYQFSYTTEK